MNRIHRIIVTVTVSVFSLAHSAVLAEEVKTCTFEIKEQASNGKPIQLTTARGGIREFRQKDFDDAVERFSGWVERGECDPLKKELSCEIIVNKSRNLYITLGGDENYYLARGLNSAIPLLEQISQIGLCRLPERSCKMVHEAGRSRSTYSLVFGKVRLAGASVINEGLRDGMNALLSFGYCEKDPAGLSCEIVENRDGSSGFSHKLQVDGRDYADGAHSKLFNDYLLPFLSSGVCSVPSQSEEQVAEHLDSLELAIESVKSGYQQLHSMTTKDYSQKTEMHHRVSFSKRVEVSHRLISDFSQADFSGLQVEVDKALQAYHSTMLKFANPDERMEHDQELCAYVDELSSYWSVRMPHNILRHGFAGQPPKLSFLKEATHENLKKAGLYCSVPTR